MDVLMKIAKALDCKVEDLFETVNDEDDENAKQ
jgi:DNA-binding Xre family transcriptional regulator